MAEREALKALTFQRLHPKAYLERFLAEHARPDGREPREWRDVSVNVGSCLRDVVPAVVLNMHTLGSISTADGSALVRLGDTTVVCGVKAEIAEPELDSPEDGFIGAHSAHYLLESCTHCSKTVPNLDLPAICSPKFRPGPPTDEAQVLSDRLNEVLLA